MYLTNYIRCDILGISSLAAGMEVNSLMATPQEELHVLPASTLNLDHLNDQVYELLREQIINGKLAPGQRLSPVALAEHLGVSVTPVRDAVRRLSGDGLVAIYARRGTFVSKPDKRSIQEIFQARRIVECAAADRVLEASDGLIRPMDRLLGEMQTQDDAARFSSYDGEFHMCIVSLLENRRISAFYQGLRWCAQIGHAMSVAGYERAEQTMAEHATILQALKQKDASKAKTAILRHLNEVEADLLSRLPPEEK